MTSHNTVDPAALRQGLVSLFGGLRAEWLRDRLFELFIRPDYFPELVNPLPVLLVGGRGTGKTTVLRGLSYEGQYALADATAKDPTTWEYYGFYWRIDTNRVATFTGPELPVDAWTRIFGHYVNLNFCQQIAHFLLWLNQRLSSPVEVPPATLELVARSLNMERVDNLSAFNDALELHLVTFEASINNVAEGHIPPLSMQGAPVTTFVRKLQELPAFQHKMFFFLLDEYENLEDYQQRVINTLIKHAGEFFTFKIGMKETGLRVRSTLNPHEQLVSPADYSYVDISQKLEPSFSEFARKICDDRLQRLSHDYSVPVVSVEEALPELSEIEEARRLGAESRVAAFRAKLADTFDSEELTSFDDLDLLEAYFLSYWSQSSGAEPVDTVRSFLKSRTDSGAEGADWRARFENYRYAMLFTIKAGKRPPRKLYAGWRKFARMSEGNIRYLLQLVTESLGAQVERERSLAEPVSPELQTAAAAEVGRRNLGELKGLAVQGAQLTKLVLSLGRIFQVMAHNPQGHAPEVNQFRISGSSPPSTDEVDELLQAAVMHLALVRFSGNKNAAVSGQTKDFDYMLHPIFAPFFSYSHRRKRRMDLRVEELLGLVHSPRETIEAVLSRSNRTADDDALPDQLELFGDFYRGISG